MRQSRRKSRFLTLYCGGYKSNSALLCQRPCLLVVLSRHPRQHHLFSCPQRLNQRRQCAIVEWNAWIVLPKLGLAKQAERRQTWRTSVVALGSSLSRISKWNKRKTRYMPLGFGDGRHSFHFKTCLLAIDERGEGGSDCSTRGGRHALPFQKGFSRYR